MRGVGAAPGLLFPTFSGGKKVCRFVCTSAKKEETYRRGSDGMSLPN
ncbi:MAG: hypothetical protein IJD81_01420 [Oscillospiraceae bacterium]|nr:hypothetical protein [Oscillospiraceae bacterium]